MERIKLQLGCLIILLFMAAVYFSAKRTKNSYHKLFSASLIVSLIYTVFDIVTVYTVNNLESVSPAVNRLCHIIFMGSISLEMYICFLYSRTLIFSEGRKSPDEPFVKTIHKFLCNCADTPDTKFIRKNIFWGIPLLIAETGIIFLPLDYVRTPKGNYSMGPAALMVYAVIACYALAALVIILLHHKKIRTCLHKRMRTTFRQILPKTALKILAGRQARLRIFALS